MPGERLSYLLVLYFQNTASDAEVSELMTLLTDPANDEAVVNDVMKEIWSSVDRDKAVFDPAASRHMLEHILKARQAPVRGRFVVLRRVAVAAAVVLLLGTGLFVWLSHRGSPELAGAQPGGASPLRDAMPGGNKATLRLANGQVIVLDSAANGLLAEQGNAHVQKLDSGRLAYAISGDKTAPVLYNTLSTPRGGQYQLLLPDGTKVWLNAASSISYPTAFTGEERKVEITGEAYFEIAPDRTKPFRVEARGMQVQVLGTQFNINAYADEEDIKTTLLEGSVRVKKDAGAVLKPGEQAVMTMVDGASVLRVRTVDTDAETAWKNGYFSFHQADLSMVMRQIARWYDVDIVYEGRIPARRFGGDIPRNANASEVLKMLEESKVHFRIEGKKIIVLP